MAYIDAGWLLSTNSVVLCASSCTGPFSLGTELVSSCCVGDDCTSRPLPLAIRPWVDRNLTEKYERFYGLQKLLNQQYDFKKRLINSF
jgi:hypothetical protein